MHEAVNSGSPNFSLLGARAQVYYFGYPSAMDAPFIGSTLTLISHSDIRYEGVLQSINPEQSTLTVAQGMCVFHVVSATGVLSYRRWLPSPWLEHGYGWGSYAALSGSESAVYPILPQVVSANTAGRGPFR